MHPYGPVKLPRYLASEKCVLLTEHVLRISNSGHTLVLAGKRKENHVAYKRNKLQNYNFFQ